MKKAILFLLAIGAAMTASVAPASAAPAAPATVASPVAYHAARYCNAVDPNGVITYNAVRMVGDFVTSTSGASAVLKNATVGALSRDWTITVNRWYNSPLTSWQNGPGGNVTGGSYQNAWDATSYWPFDSARSRWGVWSISGYATSRPGLKFSACAIEGAP